jgi:hypothetical protein
MCEECEKLDKRIGRYRVLAGQIFDPLTAERIKDLIKELEQQKEALHRTIN